jgi:hypothetical protein
MADGQHTLVFESFGVVAEVRTDDPRLWDRLPRVLPPGWRPQAGPAMARFALLRDGTITLDGTELRRAPGDQDAALIRLGSVVRHHLAQYAPAHMFIHAGVVCVGASAIVIPGSSYSGKTTLVAELVRAGAMYYSDEYAVVDDDGLIEPYPKPLSIRVAGGRGLGVQTPVAAGQIASQPIRAGLIVVTKYEAGASWRPASLSKGEAALALLGHTVAARSRPSEALAAVGRLARDARVLMGPRGEADRMAAELLALAE